MKTEEVEIKKIGINGEGIGYINKKICFVKNALPEEVVKVKIITDNGKFYKGEVLSYVKESKNRVQSFCKEADFCQGCTLTHYKYDQQMYFKKDIIKDAFRKFTDFDTRALPIRRCVESKDKYRQVVSLPVTYFNKRVCFGIYQRESKYLTLMSSCPMQDPLINECLVEIEDIMADFKIKSYSDKVKLGLRFIRVKKVEDALQVIFVTGNDGLKEGFAEAVLKIKAVKSVLYTINTTKYQEFEKQGFKKAAGHAKMEMNLFGYRYLISPKSDYPMYPRMYKEEKRLIDTFIQPDDKILTIRCGLGAHELSLKNSIVAIDENKYHIDDAKENAKFLHKENVDFVKGDIDKEVIRQCKKHQFDTVIVYGEMTSSMKQSFILGKVKNVICVTQHISSFAKDVGELDKYFKLETIIPLDKEPYTSKVHIVAQLKHK